ncbi:PhoH-like protein [Andreesenia angusta]|uniref:PhoH-like protein n=1 Tax=Andreesenia angusta TaxID=39480 RepID=A0A1S1V831_9FIRM|nr:PhoH family protein [Andreesenia angusta]OHW62560.1 PhoH-like protein [Andreesenia angusta]
MENNGEEILEKQLEVDGEYVSEIFGNYDENIELIEETLESNIALRGNTIKIIGSKESIELTEKLIQKLVDVMKSEGKITKQSLIYAMDLVVRGEGDKMKEILNDIICIAASGKTLKPKTLGQKRYIDNIRKNDIVFGIGPAGTGKTYLAMAMAVKAFRNKEVTRIILTRPAVEAGESLGFLPGDLQEKVDPYLRPLYDALFDILGAESYLKYKERGLIEVAPLAYMRGRTLESAFIILDEAQNTTTEQMKMFLTRLGNGSKAVVTGDITQIDLPPGKSSGLKQAERILKDIKGISFSYFDKTDVVRHRLVQDIIEAYEAYDKKKSMKSKES